MRECPRCNGKGLYNCYTCNGCGKIRNSSYIAILSELTSLANDWIKCYSCKGNRKIKCPRCNGNGKLNDD